MIDATPWSRRLNAIEVTVATGMMLAHLDPSAARERYLSLDEITANVLKLVEGLRAEGLAQTGEEIALEVASAADDLAALFREVAAQVRA